MLDKGKKQRIIKKYATHTGDTGSTEVQIAILSEDIKELTEHLKTHRKDFSSRRGLLKKVNQRRRLLRYLEKDNADSFEALIKQLKIKIKRSKTASLAEEDVAAALALENKGKDKVNVAGREGALGQNKK